MQPDQETPAAKHTPGPWIAQPPRRTDAVLRVRWEIHVASGDICICEINSDPCDDPAQIAADAALIAAAPDLLAALRALLDLHIAHHNNSEHVAARAAIAKATAL